MGTPRRRGIVECQCRHCGVRIGRRPRRLCWPCYFNVNIREQYPCLPRSYPADTVVAHELGEPTDHLPGTEGKILVLMERREKGLLLWHPEDAAARLKPGESRYGRDVIESNQLCLCAGGVDECHED